MRQLDHLLWEERDLREGEARFADLTGVTPAYGGPHAEGGTHNALLSLGQGRYLELIALVTGHPGANSLLGATPPDFTPRLFTFAVKAADLAWVERLAEARGLEVSRRRGERKTPSGQTLVWETAIVSGHDFGPVVPFFIRWGEVTHPSETAPQGCELLRFTVGHPRHEELAELYAALGTDVPVLEAETPRLQAVLRTPKGELVLNGA